MKRRTAILLTQTLIVGGALALVEVMTRAGFIPQRTLLPPSEIATGLVSRLVDGSMRDDIERTAATVAVAFGLAVVFGLAAGVGLHAVPRLRRAIDPLLASYYSIPVFVFYPLMVAIFGLNTLPLVTIGFAFAAVAMVLATLNGLDRVPRALDKTARLMRLSPAGALLRIRLPAAAPYLFAGIKLALAYAFIGVIGGEFIMSGSGLGYAIGYAYNNFDSETMYATMLFVLLVAIGMNSGLSAWEKRIRRKRGLA